MTPFDNYPDSVNPRDPAMPWNWPDAPDPVECSWCGNDTLGITQCCDDTDPLCAACSAESGPCDACFDKRSLLHGGDPTTAPTTTPTNHGDSSSEPVVGAVTSTRKVSAELPDPYRHTCGTAGSHECPVCRDHIRMDQSA